MTKGDFGRGGTNNNQCSFLRTAPAYQLFDPNYLLLKHFTNEGERKKEMKGTVFCENRAVET